MEYSDLEQRPLGPDSRALWPSGQSSGHVTTTRLPASSTATGTLPPERGLLSEEARGAEGADQRWGEEPARLLQRLGRTEPPDIPLSLACPPKFPGDKAYHFREIKAF